MQRSWLFALMACGPTVETEGLSEDVTWGDVAPMLASHCGDCHAPDGVGVDFSKYEVARDWSSAMVDAVATGRMPPWSEGDADDCVSPLAFVDDPSLPESVLALLDAWDRAGAPRGSSSEGEEVAWPEPTPAMPADDVLRPREAYALEPAEDAVVCATLEPASDETRWLTAAQLVPEATEVAHHAVLLLAPATGQFGARWQECTGAVGQARPLMFWAPGTAPVTVPSGSAIRLPAGSQMMVQMHYHAVGDPGDIPPPSVRLQWRDTPPDYEAELRILGNASDGSEGLLQQPGESEAEFLIPASTRGHEERMRVPVGGPPDVSQALWSIGHHMHRFGVSMETRRIEGDTTSCLLSTPVWDFDWHRLYVLDAAVDALPVLSSETEIELSCRYDNHWDHEGSRRTLEEAGLTEAIDVSLGAGALDEMCTVLMGVVYPRPD